MADEKTNDRIVKFRLVTYFEEVPNPVHPNGDTVLVERTAPLGAKVSLRAADEQRLDSLGALYTKEEAKAIEDGSYKGFDSVLLYASRGGQKPASPIQPVDGEGPQTDDMSAEELAQYITENKLNVDDTVALAGDDEDSINKVLDAENIASENDPRVGVVNRLEAKLNAATRS